MNVAYPLKQVISLNFLHTYYVVNILSYTPHLLYSFMRILIALLLLLPFYVSAQTVQVANNRILRNNSNYLLYEEKSLPLLNIKTTATDEPGWKARSFNSYIIDGPDSVQYIMLRPYLLKKGSSDTTYYYNFKLLPINKEINIIWQPFIAKSFMEDLARYNVCTSGAMSDDSLEKVYYTWIKKPGILDYRVLKEGSIYPYSPENTNEAYNGTFKDLHFDGDKVYLDGVLIASVRVIPYNRKKNAASDEKYFIVNDKSGTQVASLLISRKRTDIKLWIGDHPDPFLYDTKDISEEKMLNVAIQILLLKNILQ